MNNIQWKIWLTKLPEGHFIVWDRAGTVEQFGPFKTEKEAQKRMDGFLAELDRLNVRHNPVTADELPEWAKVQ